MSNTPHAFYLNRVYPHLPAEMRQRLTERYPQVRLSPETGFTPLTECPVCMVVGLTGTGKSTTLGRLAGRIAYRDDIPSRREIADLIVIPTAQVISGEAVMPVKGREARFAYTHKFAQEFAPGGLGVAFSWLHYRRDTSLPLVSEGVRGPDEIRYVLENCPRWHVFELWVSPLVRLQRLSQRQDNFDQLANPDTEADFAFLPPEAQTAAREMLHTGAISHMALVTLQAEARNYGHQPYDSANRTARYRFLPLETITPDDAAADLARFIEDMA